MGNVRVRMPTNQTRPPFGAIAIQGEGRDTKEKESEIAKADKRKH